MSDIKIVIAADVASAIKALQNLQTEAIKTGAAVNTASKPIEKMGEEAKKAADKTGVMTSAAQSLTRNLFSIISPSTLVVGGLIAMGKALYDFVTRQSEAEKQTKRYNDVLSSVSSEFVKAVQQVDNLKTAFEKAEKGIISQESAVKLYNKTIGQTTGQVNTLAEAEAGLVANGDAYIKYTLLKAAANVALNKSSEALFRAEVSRKEQSNVKETDFETGFFGKDKQEKFEAELIKFQNQAKKADEESKKFLDIQKSFNQDAQKIAEEFKFKPVEEITVVGKKFKVKAETAEAEVGSVIGINFASRKEAPVRGAFAGEQPEQGFLGGLLGKAKQLEGITDTLTKFANTLKKLKEEYQDSVAAIKRGTLIDALSTLGEGIGNVITGKGGIGDIFKGVASVLGGGIKQFGQQILKLAILTKLAKETLKAPALGIFAGIALIALGTAIQNATQKSAFASGTTRFGGGTALVGERGPELVNLPSGSSVMPNNQLQAFGGGGINLMPSIAYDGTIFRIFLNRVDEKISRNG